MSSGPPPTGGGHVLRAASTPQCRPPSTEGTPTPAARGPWPPAPPYGGDMSYGRLRLHNVGPPPRRGHPRPLHGTHGLRHPPTGGTCPTGNCVSAMSAPLHGGDTHTRCTGSTASGTPLRGGTCPTGSCSPYNDGSSTEETPSPAARAPCPPAPLRGGHVLRASSCLQCQPLHRGALRPLQGFYVLPSTVA